MTNIFPLNIKNLKMEIWLNPWDFQATFPSPLLWDLWKTFLYSLCIVGIEFCLKHMKHVSRKKSREVLYFFFQMIQLFLLWLLHRVIWKTIIGKIMLNCTLWPACRTNTKNLKWKDNQHPKNDMSFFKVYNLNNELG